METCDFRFQIIYNVPGRVLYLAFKLTCLYALILSPRLAGVTLGIQCTANEGIAVESAATVSRS